MTISSLSFFVFKLVRLTLLSGIQFFPNSTFIFKNEMVSWHLLA